MTTARRAGRSSTPWRPPARCPITSPRPGHPTTSTTLLLSGTLDADVRRGRRRDARREGRRGALAPVPARRRRRVGAIAPSSRAPSRPGGWSDSPTGRRSATSRLTAEIRPLRDAAPGDPARRPRLVLRLRRGARRSLARAAARDRRRRRRSRRRGELHLRGPPARRALRDVVDRGEAHGAPTPSSCTAGSRATRRSRRRSSRCWRQRRRSSSPLGLDEAFLRRHGLRGAARHARRDRLGAARARACRARRLSCCVGIAQNEALREAREPPREAARDGGRAIAEGAGVVVTMPEDEPDVLATAAAARPVGGRAGDGGQLERLGITSVAELARDRPGPARGPPRAARCGAATELAGGIDDAAGGAQRRPSSRSATKRRSPVQSRRTTSCVATRGGWAARSLAALRDSKRARAMRDAQGQVRRLHLDHEEPHRRLRDRRRRGGRRSSRSASSTTCRSAAGSGSAGCRAPPSRRGEAAVQLAFELEDPVDAHRVVDVEARHRQGDLGALRDAIDELRRAPRRERGRDGAPSSAAAGITVEPRRREDAWGPCGAEDEERRGGAAVRGGR